MINDKDFTAHKATEDAKTNDYNSNYNIQWVDILFVVGQRKKKIFLIMVVVMLITAGTSLLLSKWYESKAVILLPEKTGTIIDALSSTGSSLGGLGASLLGGSQSNVSQYLAILNSRRMREELVNRFELVRVYNVKKIEDALKILDKDLAAEADKKLGTIVITFHFFDDPEKTAEITNYVVLKLDEINRELATEQARSTRKFIEDRYQQAKTDLQNTEDSLNIFQKKFGVISIPDQTKVGIEAAAKLQAEIVTTEIEYNVKKKILGINHPDLMRLESQLDEFRKNQRRMDVGGAELSVFIPFKKTPDLALQYFRLYRDVQINGKILEFLVPQYEQAKIQEAKNTPTLLVLDKAKPADYPYKPKKKIITIVAGMIAGLFMIFFFYVKEYIWKDWIAKNKRLKLALSLFSPRNLFK